MPRGGFGDTPNIKRTYDADERMGIIPGTDEQEAIWRYMLRDTGHAIVEAVAGSGKTFTIIQYALRETTARVGLVAFNRHIADELKTKIAGQTNVECMTYHSLGYRAVRQSVRFRVEVDKHKVLDILDEMHIPVKQAESRTVKYRVASLVGYCKSFGIAPDDTDMTQRLEYLVDRFDVETNGYQDVIFDLVPKVLRACMDNLRTVDYDDQVWLPMVLDLPVPKYDVLCVDEYQDTGTTQQWLALRAATRLCAVGDPRQAIYAFRGADSRGFEHLRAKLGKQVHTFPLTLTRRCPKSHVRMAQYLVPQIVALDDAPEGIIRVQGTEEAIKSMRPGDLVVCRVNAELIGAAYKLLKRGVRAVIRGRDLGEGLRKLIENAEEDVAQALKLGPKDAVPLLDLVKFAGVTTQQQVSKYNAMPNGRGEMRAHNAQDRYDCLVTLATGCTTTRDLKNVIASLFDGMEDNTKANASGACVTLGTVHRTKGLEGNRVFILRPDLIPHPMAKGQEGLESERNLGYVAVTRAKFDIKNNKPGELIFVGLDAPPLFHTVAVAMGLGTSKPEPGRVDGFDQPDWGADGADDEQGEKGWVN